MGTDKNSMQTSNHTTDVISSFEETNLLLQQLGFVLKVIKKRSIYMIREHEMDFDFWPGIPPYMEFEGDSEEDIKEILQLLEYSIQDTVSCTVDGVYNMYRKKYA